MNTILAIISVFISGITIGFCLGMDKMNELQDKRIPISKKLLTQRNYGIVSIVFLHWLVYYLV